jgi:hypothetical protein
MVLAFAGDSTITSFRPCGAPAFGSPEAEAFGVLLAVAAAGFPAAAVVFPAVFAIIALVDIVSSRRTAWPWAAGTSPLLRTAQQKKH